MIWYPNITVAAVIEENGRFLLVEEETDTGLELNQPAGHLEQNETLIEAVIRETREEAACLFEPDALIGIYQWRHPVKQLTYIRFAFCGQIIEHFPDQQLDKGIIRTLWMTPDEIRACRPRHRSPMLLANLEDYLSGHRYSPQLIQYLLSSGNS